MTMRFMRDESGIPQLTIHRVASVPAGEILDAPLQAALAEWLERGRPTENIGALMQFPDCPVLVLDYRGRVQRRQPDEDATTVTESLVREFLFPDGVCELEQMTPVVYTAEYGIMGTDSTETLLICPFATEAGNIGGVLAMCLSRYLARNH